MSSSTPPFDLNAFTPYRLAVAAAQLSEDLSRQYKDRFGISIPEWRVLVHVSAGGQISVRDVETRAAMEKSKVSRAASRLVAKGYVEKTTNDHDRRLVQLQLTEAGRDLMKDLLPLAERFQQDVDTRLGALKSDFDAALSVITTPQD